MSTNKLLPVVLSFALALLPASLHADTFVYAIASHFASFNVDGTITTATNIGVLSGNDIVDFSLTLSANGVSETLDLNNTDNQGLYGDALSATPTGLYFDFDAANAGLFFANSSTGTYLCIQTYGCDAGYDSHISTNLGGMVATEAQTGSVQLASYVPSAVTPEPSSLFLLATGLMGAACLTRGRNLLL